MQLPDKTSQLNVRTDRATFVLSILIVFACLIGYSFTLAAQQEGAPSLANSQDISGVWVGQLSEKMADGRVGHGSLYLRLAQSGTHISGVAGDSETTASPIEDAGLSGKHLKFSVTTPGAAQGSALLKVELDANEDAMEGKGHFFRSADNHAWDVEIKLARDK